ncbi:PREDICTED: uncharacterized protein LOC104826195 isoform X2 [Tarenaya hassleriana]|uniref:uncharacterized protein LOC104826195 isoform X2 n=1 Tax=Tarenaya hassleriana TaxID=28532 RepID=UPI00053C274E|nr:PREDICTED: uncharacterized protein LOC104826195 isoform X2 [Tarenaya hassleriana]XP_010557070.1 PREDICTED: uncharacterized protein LOC104826195 isoform X2 [Tarenaya hassleriana]XP_010557071.1 PREDICTED: uncharacterized protein LOC104826195 isoform X2 [Tarenaya hassleriana]
MYMDASKLLTGIAKVHAVVVLYNYYHRRKHPHLEYMSSEAFCKMAAVFRPVLLQYLKEPNEIEQCDASQQTSLVKRVIMNACGLCTNLDVLPASSSIEKWPIGEVVIFLVDSDRKMCYLQHSEITQGVWSLIEKAAHDSHHSLGCQLGEVKDIEIVFEKLAFSAVEEATGFKQNAVMIVERHVVYSLRKERTAARFYIMRCFSENSDLVTLPIEDAINSLQGPLLQKISSVWTTTPVVEYFHMLPFSDIVADWFSRGEDEGFVEKKEAASMAVGVGESIRTEEVEDQMTMEAADIGNERPDVASGGNKRVQRQEPKVHRKTASFSRGRGRKHVPSKPKGGQSWAIEVIGCGNESSHVVADGNKRVSGGQEEAKVHRETVTSDHCRSREHFASKSTGNDQSCDDLNDRHSPNHGFLRNSPNTVQKDSHPDRKKNGFELGSDSKVIQRSADHRENGTQKRKSIPDEPQTGADKLRSVHNHNSIAVDAHNSNLDLDKFQTVILSKSKLLSETALRVLSCKRDKLILQQRNIEDEIARCDKSIHNILRGGEDDWELKLESIIECCNDVYPRRASIETTSQQSPDNSACQSYKRLKLSEPLPCRKSSCQKLDDICYENNWVLPTYRVSSSKGGFKAEAKLTERELEYTTCGEEKPNPEEARDSAAACLLAKLHSSPSLIHNLFN